MSNFKEKYFSNRVEGLSNDNRRYYYGLREIQTLKILQKVSELSIIKNGFVAADIGCGDRFLEKPISDEGMQYIGFDIHDLNLEKNPFKIKDDALNVILNYSVIEHLSDPSNFLQESYRCLKPGGVIVIETPNWKKSYRNFFDDYTHVKPYSPHSLSTLLLDFGFSRIQDFPNLRCKSQWSYINSYKYHLASLRPFTGSAPSWVPGFLKGKAKGMYVLGVKI